MTLTGLLKEAIPSPVYKPLDDDYLQCSIHQYIERVVSRHPQHLAVSDGETEYSYQQLNLRANQLADCLSANNAAGVVGVFLPNCSELVISFLGVLKASCAVVLIDADLPEERIQFMAKDAQVSIIVTSEKHQTQARDIFSENVHLIILETNLETFSEENPENPTIPENDAVLIYTSGSTGTPKGIMHTHHSWMASMGAVVQIEKYSPEDRIAQVFSPSSGAAPIGVLQALLMGASIHIYNASQYGMTNFVDWLHVERITTFRIVGAAFRQVFSAKPIPEKMKNIRLAMVGGELIYQSNFALFKKWFPQNALLRVGGGTSEALLMASCYLSHDSTADGNIMPMGYILENIKVEIWGEEDSPVKSGEVGEVIVSGISVSSGYWNKPEESESFTLDPKGEGGYRYRSGDIGYISEDGLLYIVGRQDQMVKVRGYRVELGEVESQLHKLPGIKQASVISRSDRNDSTQLLAYIVPDVENMPSIRAIRKGLAKHLPEYMVPARYTFLDKLPINTTGKVDRLALPLPGRERPPLEASYVFPNNDLEKELVVIWSEVLGIEGIGTKDDFSLLGGDSLSATQIFFLIEEGLNLKLPPSLLINTPTIRQLANKLSDFRDEKEKALVVLQKGKEGQPALILFAPLQGDVIIFRDLLKQIPDNISVFGIQSWTEDWGILISKTVEELVDEYLPLILKEQPRGLYYLGGFSFGGELAYHAAAALQKIGKEVGFVFLLDTMGPCNVYKTKFIRSFGDYWRLISQMETFKEKAEYFRQSSSDLILVLKSKLRIFEKVFQKKEKHNTITSYLKKPYVPPELDVDVIMFSAKDKQGSEHDGGETLGWDKVVKGKLKQNYLSGDHQNHFRGENAKKIADILMTAIKQDELI